MQSQFLVVNFHLVLYFFNPLEQVKKLIFPRSWQDFNSNVTIMWSVYLQTVATYFKLCLAQIEFS